jgi:cytochrome bd-type quinol oxidase subunit 2
MSKPSASDVGNFTGSVAQKTGVSQESIPTIAGSVINIIFSLVGLIFLVLIVYSGIIWMTSRGDSDQVESARNTLVTSTIGFFIIMSAYGIVQFITSGLIG